MFLDYTTRGPARKMGVHALPVWSISLLYVSRCVFFFSTNREPGRPSDLKQRVLKGVTFGNLKRICNVIQVTLLFLMLTAVVVQGSNSPEQRSEKVDETYFLSVLSI
jgi:hypothetical protein